MKTKNLFEAGKPYFFKQGGKLKRGVLQYCEVCRQPCCVNTVTITQAPSSIIQREYNSDMDDCDEMYFNEETELSTCIFC